MAELISFDNAIVPPGHEIGVLFPTASQKFLLRPFVSEPFKRNMVIQATPEDQSVTNEDVLVRLPDLRLSEFKVTVLQKWTCRVERVHVDRFVAVIEDATNPRNALEEVELDIEEVSQSDRRLVAEGAIFYWSIGYRDTRGGQRERVSSFRFARQPRLRQAEIDRIFKQADLASAILERD
jgi:hypothetical protein